MDAPNSWKIVKLVFLRKSDGEPKKRGQELWSDRSHKCHVEVVPVLCDDAHGKGERARDLEKTSYGISQQDKLSTSTGVGNKLLQRHWEWQEERSPMLKRATNNVYGKLGHQDSFRRGEAEARCENSGES